MSGKYPNSVKALGTKTCRLPSDSESTFYPAVLEQQHKPLPVCQLLISKRMQQVAVNDNWNTCAWRDRKAQHWKSERSLRLFRNFVSSFRPYCLNIECFRKRHFWKWFLFPGVYFFTIMEKQAFAPRKKGHLFPSPSHTTGQHAFIWLLSLNWNDTIFPYYCPHFGNKKCYVNIKNVSLLPD